MRYCGRRRPHGRAMVRAGADALAVLPGTQPIHFRHRKERGTRQPSPGDRADRPRRCGAVLADRPTECDGRPRSRRPRQSPVRASRSRRSRASRGSRRPVGRRRRSGEAGPHRGRALRCACRGPREDGLDRMHESRAVDAGPEDGAGRTGTRRARRAAGGLCGHGNVRIRAHRTARNLLGREGRHRHQFRAPHLARSRSAAPAGRSARGLADRRRFRPAPGSALASGHGDAVSLRVGRAGVRRARRAPRGAATSTSRDCRTRSSTSWGRSSGPAARTRRAEPRASTPTSASRRRAAARAFMRRSTRRSRSPSTRAIRSGSTPAACATSGTRCRARARCPHCSRMQASPRSSFIRRMRRVAASRKATSCAWNRAAAA